MPEQDQLAGGVDLAPEADSPSSPSSVPVRAGPWLAVGGVLIGLGLLLGDRTVTKIIDAILPLKATVKAAGSYFPAFADAYPHTSRALGVVLLLAVLAGIAARSEPVRRFFVRHEQLGPRLLIGSLILTAFALYAWLSYPPNMYPSNARIHWVDIFFNRKERFFYVLVKPVHVLFYEQPHLLQGLNGAVNVGLVYLIGARLFRSKWIPVLMATSFLVSGLMLGFANPSEDVQLNVTFLLLVVLLAVRRSPFLGLGLFLVHLGRPPFATFAGAFMIAEALFSVPEGERFTIRSVIRGTMQNRYLWQQVGLFTGLFVAWHATLTVLDLNWIFAEGRVLDAPHFDLVPRNIDGFEIYPLSMTYVLHVLWIFPAPILLANLAGLFGIKRMPRENARLFVFIWFFVGMTIFLAEYLPLMYFNVRFMAYLFPLMLVSSWLVFTSTGVRRWQPTVVGLAVLLAASSATTSTDAFAVRERVAERPITQTFYARAELRDLTEDRLVATTMTLSMRNFLSYSLKRSRDDIVKTSPGDAPEGAVVFTDESEAYPGARVLWRSGSLVLLDPA